MKHVRADQTFVYYYSLIPATEELHGLRFSRGTVASFRGHVDEANPEAVGVGRIVNLPVLPDDPTDDLYDAIQEVIYDHPEVAGLLAGDLRLEQVIGVQG